jgi:hypothetical protein
MTRNNIINADTNLNINVKNGESNKNDEDIKKVNNINEAEVCAGFFITTYRLLMDVANIMISWNQERTKKGK